MKEFCIAALCLLAGSSCRSLRTENPAETNSGLYAWATTLVFLNNTDADIGGMSKSELLDELVRADVITKTDRARMSRDAWGQEFIWKQQHIEGSKVIRIISSGPNGIFESGLGDDLWVELTFAQGKRPSIVLNGKKCDY